MKHSRNKLIAFLVFLIPLVALSQNNMKDLKKINDTYKQHDAYQFEIKYVAFNDYQTPVETETTSMQIFANGNNYYCKRKENEILINEHYRLVVDHENKFLMIDDYKTPENAKKEVVTKMGLDSILKEIAAQVNLEDPKVTIEQKKINEQEKQYIFNYSDGEFTTVKFNYSTSTFLISKAILYYREKMETEEGQPETTPRLEINYLNTNLDPHFDKQLFSEKKYALVKKGGQLELSASLKNYRIINHLLK